MNLRKQLMRDLWQIFYCFWILILGTLWLTSDVKLCMSEPLAYPDVDCPVYARVTATGYTVCADECDSEPQINAAGKKPKARDIGISRDMECNFSMGDTVYIIDKDGNLFEKKVSDSMNKRFTNRIDVLCKTKKEAYQIGKQMVIIFKKEN